MLKRFMAFLFVASLAAGAGAADPTDTAAGPAGTSQPTSAIMAGADNTTASSDLRESVRDRLVVVGLSPAEADTRLGELTEADLVKLAANPEHVGAGGVKDKTLIVIAGILVIPSILLLLVI